MIPSILDKLIIIEKETTSTNAVGTPEETYCFLKECYANLFTRSGSTQYSDVGELPNTYDEFTIRYDEDVNYKCRIKYNDDYYHIEHIEQVGRKHWLKIKTILWEREGKWQR